MLHQQSHACECADNYDLASVASTASKQVQVAPLTCQRESGGLRSPGPPLRPFLRATLIRSKQLINRGNTLTSNIGAWASSCFRGLLPFAANTAEALQHAAGFPEKCPHPFQDRSERNNVPSRSMQQRREVYFAHKQYDLMRGGGGQAKPKSS